MGMFKSWNSFLSFRDKKKQEVRYFHDKEAQEFFAGVMTTVQNRIKVLPKGQQYWRAQLGHCNDPLYDNGQIVDYNAVPYSDKRMKPLAEKASGGRVNPEGIPYLYLSTDEKTAISEVRPWVGSYVTVAQFKTLKALKIIDCSCGEIDPMNRTVLDLDKLWKLKPQTTEEAIKTVWRWIDLAFSEPVDHNDKTVDYVPTQIIAELFKTKGFDGIKYKSLFNNGSNLALYDIESVKQVNERKVIQVTKIDVDFKQIYPTFFQKS
jgi:hypothetical protein